MKNFPQALEELKNGSRVRRIGARWFVQMVDKRLCTYKLDGAGNRVYLQLIGR